jgi:hypothetical protein
MDYSIPANANMSVKWTAQGNYVFHLEYRAEGTPSKNVPIECWQAANTYYSVDNQTFGSYTAQNGLGALGFPTLDSVGACNMAFRSYSGELKFINTSGTQATYTTSAGTAMAESEGPNAAAFAEVNADLRPSAKNISISLTTSPVYDEQEAGEGLYTFSFPNSSRVVSKLGPMYTQVPFLPTNTGISSYEIAYRVGRPSSEKLFRGVLLEDNSVAVVEDLSPSVPVPFAITHVGAATPLGQLASSDVFYYTSGDRYTSPPRVTIPASPSIIKAGGMIQNVRVFDTNHRFRGNRISPYFSLAETVEERLTVNWGDGVSGKATSKVTLINPVEYVNPDFLQLTILFDQLDWEKVTPLMEPGSAYRTTRLPVSSYVAAGAGAVDVAAVVSKSRLQAGIAAALGIVAAAIDASEGEEFQFDVTWAEEYEVAPSTWRTHLGVPSGSSFIDHRHQFHWQLQFKPGASVSIALAQRYGLSGFEGMITPIEYTRGPHQGRYRSLMWLHGFDDELPGLIR